MATSDLKKNKLPTKGASDDVPVLEGEIAKRAKMLGVPLLEKVPDIDVGVISIIPEDVAREYKIVPFEKDGKNIKVAMVDPQNINALNVLRFIAEKTSMSFDTYLASEETIGAMMRQYYGGEEGVIKEAMQSLQEDGSARVGDAKILRADDEEEGEGNDNDMQSAPVKRLLNVIIRHAIDGKASDIHIEPFNKEFRVRFRVDGILYASLSIPKQVGRAVISRIKILSSLKIDERRKPQDGRFKIIEEGRAIDFRVSTLPVIDGEKAVLRILDNSGKTIDTKELGLIGKGSEILIKNIREPYGIIMITGPTGSGKSTTLYACLEILNKEERNIITLEDPVEYSIAGVNQSQINPDIDYTFANGLRSILRQDPNVIMVGEIRDGETAELTIHAALTGHLVLTTLHTNSSIGAIPRLIDMGIEPFLLSSSLRVVAAQRLVRRICEKCKKEATLPKAVFEEITRQIQGISVEDIKKYGVDFSDGMKIYEGSGCDACGKTGYKGRLAIFEALEIDSNVKEIISEKRGSEKDIEDHAAKNGMITIKQDGILKALLGMTTIAEVERVTEGSRSVGGDVDDDKG
jgi:type IV pilus assembly protein PilB